jgi:predicted DCC family thiol-disulfide oxidoreductase YuxK
VQQDKAQATVFFDGACPLCRAEIGLYRRQDRAGSLCFVDVSQTAEGLPAHLTQQQAMARFRVLSRDGRLLSGAAAFVGIWRLLPGGRWAARAAALTVLELGYPLFLPVRPIISELFGRLQALGDHARKTS